MHAAAAFKVDKRKPPDKEIVTQVNHIRLWKEDDRVAVRMAIRIVDRFDVLAVKMDRNAVLVRDHRPCLNGRCRNCIAKQDVRLRHPFADVYVRDDSGILTKELVAFGMVGVPMRI